MDADFSESDAELPVFGGEVLLSIEDEPLDATPGDNSAPKPVRVGSVSWNQKNRCYRCSVGFRNIVVYTDDGKTLAVALELQTTLVSIKRYAEESVKNGATFPDAFPQAVDRAVDEIEGEKPTLRFGLLVTFGNFQVWAGIKSHREVAEAWARMSGVRKREWPAHRALFIDLWSKGAKEAKAQARAEAVDSKWEESLVKKRSASVRSLAKRISALLKEKRKRQAREKAQEEEKMRREEKNRAEEKRREEQKRGREEEKRKEQERLEEMKARQKAAFAAAAARQQAEGPPCGPITFRFFKPPS